MYLPQITTVRLISDVNSKKKNNVTIYWKLSSRGNIFSLLFTT